MIAKLSNKASFRRACLFMVEVATNGKCVSFTQAYEFLKREWNVNSIQDGNRFRGRLADIFYAVRDGYNAAE